MNDLGTEAMGSVAGALGMVGYVPQVIRAVWRGTAGDLSGWMLAIFAVNTTLWTVYGILKQAWALAGSDAIVLALLLVLLVYKLRDLRREARQA
jgi:MtN3 and saliva related transmembrane protein